MGGIKGKKEKNLALRLFIAPLCPAGERGVLLTPARL